MIQVLSVKGCAEVLESLKQHKPDVATKEADKEIPTGEFRRIFVHEYSRLTGVDIE